MIVTITPNPSIDLLFDAERLVWDDANRLPLPRRRAGGQGINLVRALQVLGSRGTAVALLHGRAGDELEAMLRAEHIALERVEGEAETRVFVAVRERDTGRSMLLNPRGGMHSAASADALCVRAREVMAAQRPRWVVCSGSVPPGIDAALYARIARDARERGTRFVADCDGELLRNAVDAGCDLLVPNRHEAARLTGIAIESVADAVRAAEALRDRGADVACVTMEEQGAVIAGAQGRWHARAPLVREGSAVGAGDAFLAAVLLAIDECALPEVVRRGVAAGTAVLQSEGGDLLTEEEYRRQLDRVDVSAL